MSDDFEDAFADMDDIAEDEQGEAPEPEGDHEVVNGIEIDYDVPVPSQSAAGGGPKPKWPWHAVKVGGSIKFTDPKHANSAVSSAKRWAKSNPNADGSTPEFIRRATGSKQDPEFRVFRIK